MGRSYIYIYISCRNPIRSGGLEGCRKRPCRNSPLITRRPAVGGSYEAVQSPQVIGYRMGLTDHMVVEDVFYRVN